MMKHSKPLPALELLDSLFRPDFEAGKLYWKVRPRRNTQPGEEAAPGGSGRARIGLNGTTYKRARVLWAMFHRQDPGELVVDHIDGNPGNDAIHNLRAVAQADNVTNVVMFARAGKMPPGVRHDSKCVATPFHARIGEGGKKRLIGYYATKEEAHAAYVNEVNRLGRGRHNVAPTVTLDEPSAGLETCNMKAEVASAVS